MIKIPGIFKKLGEAAAVEVGLVMIRKFLNEKIKEVTPGDLYTAIQTNQDLWDVTPNDMRSGGSRLKQRFGQELIKYQNEINTDKVLEWLAEDHQDLYSTVLNTEGGVVYMGNQVEKLKYIILREL